VIENPEFRSDNPVKSNTCGKLTTEGTEGTYLSASAILILALRVAKIY